MAENLEKSKRVTITFQPEPWLFELIQKEEGGKTFIIHKLIRDSQAQKEEYDEKDREREKENKDLKLHIDALINNLKEKSNLESEMKNLKNALLERDGKIGKLETENVKKDELIKKLSESELLTENDGLHVELGKKNDLIVDYANEIKKLEALREKERQATRDIVLHVKATFKDFLQYAPKSEYDIPAYLTTLRKIIGDFEGYLNTLVTTTL
jgi:hypothetical protein